MYGGRVYPKSTLGKDEMAYQEGQALSPALSVRLFFLVTAHGLKVAVYLFERVYVPPWRGPSG